MYATSQDMIDRYGTPRMVQLTDVGAVLTGAVVAAVMNARLADADAEIDGYLAGRMALPLASPPAILRDLACRLAYGRLLGNTATEPDLADLKAARAYLRDVAAGTISLVPPADAPALAGAGAVLFEPGQKVMGREDA